MPEPVLTALAALTYLLVKHAFADFFLQTPFQHRNKGRYGHPGGLVHAAIHAAGTAPVFVLITPDVTLGAAILAGEFVLHYHFDWMKDRMAASSSATPADPAFWRLIGLDQLLHGLTYIAIVGILFWQP